MEVATFPFQARLCPMVLGDRSQCGGLLSLIGKASVLSIDDLTEKASRVADETVVERTLGTIHVGEFDPGPPNLWEESYAPLKLVGDNGTAYVRDGDNLIAIDVTTWSTLWTVEQDGDRSSPWMAAAC